MHNSQELTNPSRMRLADSKLSFCKLLITEDQLDKLMEFCGGDIGAVKSVTGCACRVSMFGNYFPGTTDRIISLIGPLVQLCVAIQLVSDVFRICASVDRPGLVSGDHALIGLRLIVPNSVVGVIMGKGGKDIRSLAVHNSVRIQISKRISGVLERMVSVVGRSDHVCAASFVLVETLQGDYRTSEHASILSYSVSHSPCSSGSSPSTSASSLLGEPEDNLMRMTRNLDSLVSQLAKYPRLFSEIRNAY